MFFYFKTIIDYSVINDAISIASKEQEDDLNGDQVGAWSDAERIQEGLSETTVAKKVNFLVMGDSKHVYSHLCCIASNDMMIMNDDLGRIRKWYTLEFAQREQVSEERQNTGPPEYEIGVLTITLPQ